MNRIYKVAVTPMYEDGTCGDEMEFVTRTDRPILRAADDWIGSMHGGDFPNEDGPAVRCDALNLIVTVMAGEPEGETR